MKEHEDRFVTVVENQSLDGANTITLIQHKHKWHTHEWRHHGYYNILLTVTSMSGKRLKMKSNFMVAIETKIFHVNNKPPSDF